MTGPATARPPEALHGAAAPHPIRSSPRPVALTTRGRCLLAGGIATAACAIPLEERDLLRVGAVVALLPLLALALAAASRATVRVRRGVAPPRLPAGALATVELDVRGHGGLGAVELVDTVPDAAGPTRPPRFLVRVGRGGASVRYPLRPVLRGAHRIGPLLVHGVGPLGLAELARTARGTDQLLVLPRVVALRGLPPGAVDGAHGAGTAGVGQGRADVLVRPYRSGDELRRVHWRSTARHGELMVRPEERPWRGGVTVLLDRRAGAHRGHGPGASLEWAVDLAASVCVHLAGRGAPVELVTEDGARLPPAASAPAPGGGPSPGAGTPDALLDALAVLRPSARVGLGGPPLPGTGQVLALLGATAPEELAGLLARCSGPGLAVLLDVASWGAARAPVFTPAGAAPPAAATATALRAAGWRVALAGRGTDPARVWDELVAASTPAVR